MAQEIEYLQQICIPRISIKTCHAAENHISVVAMLLKPLEIQYMQLIYQHAK